MSIVLPSDGGTPSLPFAQIRLGAPEDGHAACDVAGDVFDAEGVPRLFHVAVAGGEQCVVGGGSLENDGFRIIDGWTEDQCGVFEAIDDHPAVHTTIFMGPFRAFDDGIVALHEKPRLQIGPFFRLVDADVVLQNHVAAAEERRAVGHANMLTDRAVRSEDAEIERIVVQADADSRRSDLRHGFLVFQLETEMFQDVDEQLFGACVIR